MPVRTMRHQRWRFIGTATVLTTTVIAVARGASALAHGGNATPTRVVTQGMRGALKRVRTTRGVLIGLVAILALVATACGGGDGDLEGVTCEPTGTTLQISAVAFGESADGVPADQFELLSHVVNAKFDTNCLAVPAGEAFEIVFDNRTPIEHNVAIYPDEGEPLFRGEIFAGVETKAYDVPAIEAGTYRFQCDVHPEMNGAFIAK